MSWLLAKYLLTAAVVVLVSEVAKRSGQMGALLTALPTTALLTLAWMRIEQQPMQSIADYAWYTFWYVVPTLPFFLLLPALLQRLGFGLALLATVAATLLIFALWAAVLRRFGIQLL